MGLREVATSHQRSRDSIASHPTVLPIPIVGRETVLAFEEPYIVSYTKTASGASTLHAVVPNNNQYVNFLRDTRTNTDLLSPVATGPNSPSNSFERSDGDKAWSNLGNVFSSDDTYAQSGAAGNTSWTVTDVRLVVSGVPSPQPVGDNLADNATVPSSDSYQSYGGPNELWGDEVSITQINQQFFGVQIQYTEGIGGGTTNTLVATQFGFNIDSEADVVGIKAEFEHHQEDVAGAITDVAVLVDHIRLTIYTNEVTSGAGLLVSQTAGAIDTTNFRVDLDTDDSVEWICAKGLKDTSEIYEATPVIDTNSQRTNSGFSPGTEEVFPMDFPITLSGKQTQIELSADGGTNWENVSNGETLEFANPGTELRMRWTSQNDGVYWKTADDDGYEVPIKVRFKNR